VNVHVDAAMRSYTSVPLISPSCAGAQIFVNHPQVSSYMRHELAALLCEQGDLVGVRPSDGGDLAARMEALGAHQTAVTLSHLAPGLPVYDVRFGSNGRIAIEHAGDVAPRG
jgi:hypothetical protein